MNKLLIILLILVIIKLFNYKEGLCPSSCSECKYININSIMNGTGPCGKECIKCTTITMSDYLKILLNKMFGTNIDSSGSDVSGSDVSGVDISGSNISGSDSGTSHNECVWKKDHTNNLWLDASNCNIQPSLYNCDKDENNNWIPYINGNSLCLLDINGIWRYSRDVEDTVKTECEPIKCVADFGTEVGQLTCCGQNSTLKSTKYVCPSNLPTCNKFKCGSEFGTCSK
jgi:hypothetical protein